MTEHKQEVDYYSKAVSRNIGIITDFEQNKLKQSRVAIAGLGGMGGIDFLTLVRMGIGKFNIADMDTFDAVNSNRQVGANSKTVGKSKLEVMAQMAKEIAPDVEISLFPDGFQEHNADLFLQNADIVIDAIDFFCLSARQNLYKHARRHSKTVVFAAPLGFSTTLHVFLPQAMSFEDYFDLHPGMHAFDKLVAFAVGVAPAALHTNYMEFDPEKLSKGIGSSIASSCNLGSGLVATELVSILLNRKKPLAAPHYIQFDSFLMKLRKGYLPFGNRGPIQKLKRWLITKKYVQYREAISLIVK